VRDYTPQQVKAPSAAAAGAEGPGPADGADAAALPDPPRPDHAADALAVAICHANHGPLARAVELREVAR
jgi:crossover junction endodeoxyribonuclease RuvC